MADYVYGLNKSGISVIKLLNKQKKFFDCWDDNKEIRDTAEKYVPKLTFKRINNINISNYDNIFLTPGISVNHKNLKNISKYKIKRDLNIYYENIKNEKIIAITGTNGKSTTTKLIGEIISKKFNKTFVGGNIGEALCNSLINNHKYSHHVIELSSFQLETISNFNPKISILLNLSEDHLDRYKSIKHYIKAKKNILNNHKKNINLISIDDKYSKKIFNDKKIINKISFSIKNRLADIYYEKDYLVDNFFYKNKKIILNNISPDLKSRVNMQNILVAYIVCKYIKVPMKFFNEGIKKFRGLPYRSLIILDTKSKLIINNSKATNISSALSTLENKKNIFLILGGVAKENGFEKFCKFKKEIKRIYIFGKSRHLINNQINLHKITKLKKNLNQVVEILWKDILIEKDKASIIFAPACASFDQFENFEKRGEYFNQLIFKKLNK